MLGERQNRWVTQSAWIKSLAATFVRSWDRRSGASGGLFGGRSQKEGEVLGWSRAQQAAFLVFSWCAFRAAVAVSKERWALALRHPRVGEEEVPRPDDLKADDDLAFYSPHSLIVTDQGVRGVLQVLNDLFYARAAVLKLNSWRPDARSTADPVGAVERELTSLKEQPLTGFIEAIAARLASFDWRTSAAPGLPDDLRRTKLVFRGSGGYKELRAQLLEHLAKGEGDVGSTAKRLLAAA
jgi:hypothetical protein